MRPRAGGVIVMVAGERWGEGSGAAPLTPPLRMPCEQSRTETSCIKMRSSSKIRSVTKSPKDSESFAQFIQFLIVRYAYRLYWT